jgi:hypothetical protein
MTRKPASPDAHRRPGVLAAIALLTAACSGSPGSHGAQRGSTATQSSGALAFSRCMRSHGVPYFPDPSRGGIPKESPQQLGVSGSQYQAALNDCQHLLPNSGGPTQAQIQQTMSALWKFRPVHALPRGAGLARPQHR